MNLYDIVTVFCYISAELGSSACGVPGSSGKGSPQCCGHLHTPLTTTKELKCRTQENRSHYCSVWHILIFPSPLSAELEGLCLQLLIGIFNAISQYKQQQRRVKNLPVNCLERHFNLLLAPESPYDFPNNL